MTAADRPSSRGAVRSRLRAGVVAGLVIVAVVAGLLIWHGHDDTYVVPSAGSVSDRPASEQPSAAAAALAAWARAVSDHRPADAPGAAARTASANADRLRVEDFTARYIAPAGAVADDGSWTADVALTWRFAGFDTTSASEEVGVTFAPAAGGVEIIGFGGGGDRLPVWLSGPVAVRRTAETMVVIAGSGRAARQRADRFDALAQRAVATVRRVLSWSHPDLVLEVPADQAGIEQMMGAATGSYHGVAAVTATVDGSDAGPVHVLVNPQVIGGLNTEGAQIVMSHEAVHVATFASQASLPSWLLEGFADYVALRDVSLPLSTTARQILAEVRADGAPHHLPGAAEFNDQSESFGAEYEAAWLACRLLARTAGEQALVRVYDAARDGTDIDTALRRETGLGLGAFTARWRHELTELAR